MERKNTSETFFTAQEDKAKQTSDSMYDNLRRVCIQNVNRRYLKPEGNKNVDIGYEFQAKKFPCYKDI